VGEKQFPFASFKSVENSIFIAFAKFRKIFDTIDVNQKFTPEQTLDTILQYWPTDSPTGDPNGANRPGDQTIKTSNPTEYDNLVRRVKQAFQKGVTLNMWQSTEVNQNQNVSPPSPSATPPAPGVSSTPSPTPTPTPTPPVALTPGSAEFSIQTTCQDCASPKWHIDDIYGPIVNIQKQNQRWLILELIKKGEDFEEVELEFPRVSLVSDPNNEINVTDDAQVINGLSYRTWSFNNNQPGTYNISWVHSDPPYTATTTISI
jgi:hypothetical protein